MPDGILARRAARYLSHAFELVPARVATVLFRTWFAGWCTARRFQVGQASCSNRDVTDDTRTLQLLLLYAVYTASNCLRFCQPELDPAKWHEFLLQYVQQGASQSSAPQKIVHDARQGRMALRPHLA